MLDLSCYSNIIGVTSKDCECLDNENRPEDYNVSNSGLFLDDLEPLNQLQGLESCDSDLWKIATGAIDQATRLFIGDTNALILKNFKLTRQDFSGGIGEGKARTFISSSRRYLGIRAAVATVRSAFMKVRGIGVLLDTDAAFNVMVYNNLNELIDVFPVTAVANKHTITPIELDLPLYNKYSNPLEYFFVYDRLSLPVGTKIRENKVDCGCGRFKPVFDLENPYYYGHQRGKNSWANWAMFGGVQKDTLIDFDDCGVGAFSTIYGLTLEVKFGCKIQQTLCDGELDFDSNPLALAMAMAIRYKASALLAESMLISGKFSRYLTVSGDDLNDSRLEWIAAYNEHVSYLISAISEETSDCISCRSFLDLETNGIFS